MKRTNTQKGITLIALILTIVILIIFAVVTIFSIRNDGILAYATNTSSMYNQTQINEGMTLQNYADHLNKNTQNAENEKPTRPSESITPQEPSTPDNPEAQGYTVYLADVTYRDGAVVSFSTDNGTTWTDVRTVIDPNNTGADTFSGSYVLCENATQIKFKMKTNGNGGIFNSIDYNGIEDIYNLHASDNASGPTTDNEVLTRNIYITFTVMINSWDILD